MGYFDYLYREETGLEKLPAGEFVLPIVNGNHAGMWIARADIGGGTSESYFDSEAEGLAFIEAKHEGTRRFWRAKIAWVLAGDRVDDHMPQLTAAMEAAIYHGGEKPMPKKIPTGRRNVLRKNGQHYVVRHFGIDMNHRDARGFGGRVFRWYFLDDPEKTVHESNDLFTQGKIPDEFRGDLPDNIEWVPDPKPRQTVAEMLQVIKAASK